MHRVRIRFSALLIVISAAGFSGCSDPTGVNRSEEASSPGDPVCIWINGVLRCTEG